MAIPFSIPFSSPDILEKQRKYLSDSFSTSFHLFPLYRIISIPNHPNPSRRIVCGCYDSECENLGKHPKGKWGNPERMSLEEMLAECQSVDHWRGFGLHVGRSSLIVIDLDPRHGGLETFATVVAKYSPTGAVPDTYSVSTGRRDGGRHIYFKAPAETDPIHGLGLTKVELGRTGGGVELFSGQHYIVAPWSPHKSGYPYTENGTVDQVADCPAWLLDAYAEQVAANEKERAEKYAAKGTPVNYPPASRPAYYEQSFIDFRVRRFLEETPPSIQGIGTGSKICMGVARALVWGFSLSISEALDAIQPWNSTCQPPWSDRELLHKLEDAESTPDPRGRSRSYLLDAERPERPTKGRHAATKAPVNLDADTPTAAEPTSQPAATALHPSLEPLTQAALDATFADVDLAIAGINAATVTADIDIANLSPRLSEYAESKQIHYKQCPKMKRIFMGAGHYEFLKDEKGKLVLDKNDKVIEIWIPEPRAQILHVPCQRINCPECNHVKKAHYKATVETRLNEHAAEFQKRHRIQNPGTGPAPPPILFSFDVYGADEWKAVYAEIHKRKGNYFRLETSDESYKILVDLLPPSVEGRPHTVFNLTINAIDSFCKSIDDVPRPEYYKTGILKSCIPWSLIPDREKKEERWRRVGKLDKPNDVIKSVLDANKFIVRCRDTSGEFWKAYSWVFDFRLAINPNELKRLFDKLQEGSTVPMYDDIGEDDSVSKEDNSEFDTDISNIFTVKVDDG